MTAVAYFQPLPDLPLSVAIERGRSDVPFFSHYFLERELHDGQCEWVSSAESTINILATANRYGKTTTLAVRHIHRCFYKVGAEPKFIRDGVFDQRLYQKTKYETIHTAKGWDTAELVWHDAHKIIDEAERIRPWVKDRPRSLPPHITFLNGARWKFRTLGDNGSGIDGNSFYYISIDEAGWIPNLREIMDNVARIRVADVRGVIDIVGTFKPGVSKDFYSYARRASTYTGRTIGFDHRDGRDYFKEFDLMLDGV